MSFFRRHLSFSLLFALAALAGLGLAKRAGAQQYPANLYSGMRWRLIGPFRGGRSLTATGVPGHPNTFYFGAVGGGVWKTTDAGRVWRPIFDHEPIASIGAIAVAPSNPDILYVGSGEADMRSDISYGDGAYKSTDAGRTWKFIGLAGTRQIGRIVVDPQNPDIVFVGALGHAYGPNPERGVFRSTDGGKTWQKVLYKDENTGAIDLAMDPSNPNKIFAALWQTRRPPWNVYPPSNGPGSGLYLSTDGGNHWRHLTGHGLPSAGLGREGIAIAPSDPNRVYLIADAKHGGLYRSDDGGENWTLENPDHRIWGRGWYFCGIAVDPKNENVVYVADTSLYRSTEGGKNFIPIKGAPGGDDYHFLWISPQDPNRMILTSDQGVIISVDGAKTWSSWYNQPTGQFYHVITDNQFPYWVYGAQQDSGAAMTTSRSIHRGISARDWRPIDVGDENGYLQPDPLDPNIVYGGFVTRENITTGENQNISPTLVHPSEYRSTWTLPLIASPIDPHVLYYGTQVLFQTSNGGQSWEKISPDLTRENPGVPPNLDPTTAKDGFGGPRRGVIYTIAPSPVRPGEIWIGTDDGLIQVTRNEGKTWQNVTPPEITPWSKISLLEASHDDANTVYAAVDRRRLDDLTPYIYRTHDGGKTWQLITKGIPVGSYVHVVREDPYRKGLLFAGTETGVFVSFNDGDEWQPLQLNLPNCSVRDLVIHKNDLVIATHGRAFWILDDITPLRQLDAKVANSNAWLFKPETAYRIRPGSDEGTPLPPEVPAGKNPPNGAIIDYYLASAATTPVSLAIYDSKGGLVRQYSSASKPVKVNVSKINIPAYWIHPPKPPSAAAGMHRFVWDLHYAGAKGAVPSYYAYFGFGGGPWALPGDYTVKLTVDGNTYSQPLTVRMDPRVSISDLALQKQFKLAMKINQAIARTSAARADASGVYSALKALRSKTQGRLGRSVATLDGKVGNILGVTPPPGLDFSGLGPPPRDRTSLHYLVGALGTIERAVEGADAAPTAEAIEAFADKSQKLQATLGQWNEVKSTELPKLNASLRRAGLQPIVVKAAEK